MKYFFLTVAVSLLWFAVLLICRHAQKRKHEKLVADLSDLIESISRMSVEPVFPEFDDSLTSKLQSQVVHLTETLKDSAERRRQERDEIKSLISDISHQLKTPVAILQTYGELMTDMSETEENRANYSVELIRALEKLRFLTDSLVKMSRLEGGVVSLRPQCHSLNETVLSAVMQIYNKAVKKNINIEFDSEKCKIDLCHDPKWTAEAIFNILDNAVKYGPDGSTVTLSLTKQEMYSRLDITDEGVGISETEMPKIFQRFYRGENAATEEGSGIGLYLTRKIITEQHGYIKVRSSDRTTFSVYLPN